MNSSYSKNNYGEVFYNIIRSFRALVAVELGVLNGYSTYYISKAIKDNEIGHLDSYDLWNDYQYKHGNMEEVSKMLLENGLDSYVTLHKEDAYEVCKKYASDSVNFLHVDISNTGDTVHRIMQDWDSKIQPGSIIVFEGGSEERDNIEWMVKYNKPSIKQALNTNNIIEEKYIFCTYLKFPSLTVLLKKRNIL